MKKTKKTLNSQLLASSCILGIDPGYGRVGIAIIESERGNQKLIYSGCFETDAKLPHPERLLLVGEKIRKTIEQYKPQQIAIETLLWSKNTKTALQVAEARGVILLEAARKKCLVREFNPNQIKLAVTGYGKSDKKQVINMVEKLMKMKPNPSTGSGQERYDDEYDAIATALTCAAISFQSTLSTEKPV